MQPSRNFHDGRPATWHHVPVLLTITTTQEPATDLGYLLVKHPDRMHTFELPTGTAYVCFPAATAGRCTAALIVEVDLARLAGRAEGRRRAAPPEGFTLGRHVNDRPYAASSLLAAALNRVFRTAMRGECRDRPDLAAAPMPLELGIPVLRCRGGAHLATSLFAPLGWTVAAEPIPLDEAFPAWGESRYVALTLTGTARLADALRHLYVLLPVLDDTKHYWVAPDEVDKLLRAGDWLATHPERDLIARRYLMHRRSLAAEALDRLDALTRADDGVEPDSVEELDGATSVTDEEADMPAAARLAGGAGTPWPAEAGAGTPSSAEPGAESAEPARVSLAQQRRAAVLAALAETGASRVLDLGCGAGALIAELMKVRSVTEIVGVDISPQVLDLAQRRLRLDRVPERKRDRVPSSSPRSRTPTTGSSVTTPPCSWRSSSTSTRHGWRRCRTPSSATPGRPRSS
jgi:hypothetical protein